MKVTLYYSPCPLFLAYFNHPWFVVEENNTTTRYEVRHIADYPRGTSYGHLVVNGLQPLEGLSIIPYLDIFGRFQARTLAIWEGNEAERIASALQYSPKKYPHLNRYRLYGPNSNTYASWILKSVGINILPPAFRFIGWHYN